MEQYPGPTQIHQQVHQQVQNGVSAWSILRLYNIVTGTCVGKFRDSVEEESALMGRQVPSES